MNSPSLEVADLDRISASAFGRQAAQWLRILAKGEDFADRNGYSYRRLKAAAIAAAVEAAHHARKALNEN